MSLNLKLHSRLQPYLHAVIDYQFGLERCPATVVSTTDGNSATMWKADCNNEITFEFPFAGQLLRWQFLFDLEDLSVPPDVLAEDGFLESQTPEQMKEMIPSLGNWNGSDPKSLLILILELLNLYQAYQIAILKNDAGLQRYYFEYETLMEMGVVAASDLEVAVQLTARESTVDFLVALDIDISALPLVTPDPVRPLAVLLVSYLSNGKATVEIHVWDELENFLGRVMLPAVEEETTLMDYVPNVREMLKRRVDKVVADLNTRQHLFCALAQLIEPAILDADSISCSRITFLLQVEHVEGLCTVHIPFGFPKNIPTISIIKGRLTENKEISITSYHLNANWSYLQMAQKILDVTRNYLVRNT